MYLTEIGSEIADWIHMAQNNTSEDSNELWSLIKGGESLDLLSNYYYILREDSRM
jgi:hypothetical protein